MTRPAPNLTTAVAHHGTVGVHRWRGTGTAHVVAIPGVDGSGEGFATVADQLDQTVELDALDLRGRGAAGAEGPFGVDAHALDVIALLDTRPTPIAALVGHSFGGHVAARVAADRPDLVPRLVLIDGGPARTIPPELTPHGLAELALGNIVPNLASKPHAVSEAAVRADFLSMVADDASTSALVAVDVPVSLIRAGQGMADGLPPVITDEVVEDVRRAGVEMTDLLVPDATHFSLLGEHASHVTATLGSIV